MPPCMAAVMVNAGRRGVEDRSGHHKTKLRESLLNNAKKLFVKFREWDIDGDGLVDKEEFRNAIPKMGIPMMAKIAAADIDDLFDTLDIDGSGAISYKELKTLLRNKPVYKNRVMRYTMAVVDFCNSTTVQTLLYAAFVFVFQMLTETLRNPKLEFYFDTHISDTIMENHFDSSHNVFEDIRRIADIYEWGNYVLWPGLLGNVGPFEDSVGRPGEHVGQTGLSWSDGDGSFHGVGATAYTVGELVERMDQLDWSDGVYLRQARVAETKSEDCNTQQLAGSCLPEMDLESVGVMDERSFGYNWSQPKEPPREPYIYKTREQLGSRIGGQMSAAITSMRMQPTDGFVALAIPFFAVEWLPEQAGLCDPAAGEVSWYKNVMLNRSYGTSGPNASFFCVRLSPNGRDCRQLCDETDIGWEQQLIEQRGKNTGVIRAAIEGWWNDLKRGHFLDVQTRVLTMQLQCKSNNIGIRNRMTILFEFTSPGGVLPSYDMETMVVDDVRLRNMSTFMNVALLMCGFFVLLEGVELFKSGPSEYFGDLWNLMDWLNFLVFFQVWWTLSQMLSMFNDGDPNPPCTELCRTVGYVDLWELMGTSRDVKTYLSICVCIQLLKIIKFTNVLIPKMGLMTGVLGAGKMDLLFFGIVFGLSMFAFSNLFYIQLGAVMPDFNDQVASFLSLARALFGDFDIDDIMNNSSGYTNAVLFLVYLFVAVFILLSMFLAILGEAQAAVRGEQDAEEEAGTAPPAYGVFSILAGQLKTAKARLTAKVRKRPYPDLEDKEDDVKSDKDDDKDEKERAVLALKLELTASLGGIRTEVGRLAQQVTALAGADADAAAKPAAAELGSFEDARALRKVVETMEQRMTRKLTQIDERLARGPRASKSGQRSRPPPAAGEAAAAGESGGGQSRRRRTPAAAVQAAAPEDDQTMTC